MAQLKLNCPYCSTEAAGFDGSNFFEVRRGTGQYAVFMQCGVCGEAAVARFERVDVPSWIRRALYGESPPTPTEIFPKPESLVPPAHAPPNVERYFLQAADSL